MKLREIQSSNYLMENKSWKSSWSIADFEKNDRVIP
jgi:hypothetical protein